MPGSSDFFTKVGAPTATSLASPGHTIGGATFNVGSTAGWPTDTGVFFAVDTVTIVNGSQVRNPGSLTVWEGVVSGSTTISNAVIRFGTDQNYSAGATTRVYIAVHSSRENRIIDGLLNFVDQDATLKAGAVDNAAVLANNVVTTAKVADNAITGSKIATYKIIRQNDTTNVTETSARRLTGYGYIIPGTSTPSVSETVTFDAPFTSPPIVVATWGGDTTGATTYGSGGINVQSGAYAMAFNITTTGFTVRIQSTGTNWTATSAVFYQWMADGV